MNKYQSQSISGGKDEKYQSSQDFVRKCVCGLIKNDFSFQKTTSYFSFK